VRGEGCARWGGGTRGETGSGGLCVKQGLPGIKLIGANALGSARGNSSTTTLCSYPRWTHASTEGPIHSTNTDQSHSECIIHKRSL